VKSENAWQPSFWRALTTPKTDSAPEENEDAFAASPTRGQFALADGATQSSFSGQWARLLVDAFTQSDEPENLSDKWLAPLRKRWADSVDQIEVPWFVAANRELGAFAAILGLSLKAENGSISGRWSGVSIGDVCVFQVRHGKLHLAWPLEHSSEFNNRPALIGSRGEAGDCHAEVIKGAWQAGDCLLLMTDALACWYLSRIESGRNPWTWISALIESDGAEQQFVKIIANLRRTGELKDDDTTLMAIRV